MKGFIAIIIFSIAVTYVISIEIYHNNQLGDFLIYALAIVFSFVWLPIMVHYWRELGKIQNEEKGGS